MKSFSINFRNGVLKNEIYKFLLFLFFFSFYNVGISQTQMTKNGLPDIFPVNPKAFEFMKYNEVPVSKYTGLPSLSIPIYTINLNGLTIPIEITYHSNGFKVNEEAGWTGLGWSLNPGGSIVQVINEFDDFGWYRNRNDEMQNFINSRNIQSIATPMINNGQSIAFGINPEANLLYFDGRDLTIPFNLISDGLSKERIASRIDTRPDLFKFNMLGYSGEFILDWKTETFKCTSDKNIKVVPYNYLNSSSQGDNVHPTSFEIITYDGNRFLFEVKEETIISGVVRYSNEIYPQLDHLIGSKSSRVYQLTKITSSGGDVVVYNYLQTPLLENLPTITLSRNFSSCNLAHKPQNIPFKNNPTSTTINYTKQSLSYLSSIEFSSGKLIFNSSNDRSDFIGMHKLNNILLNDRFNNTIKSINLAYDYFVGSEFGNNMDAYLDGTNPTYHCNKASSELLNRLKLISVTESGKPSYLFEYDLEPLPKKTTLSVDYWGFYNRKNNVSIMPNTFMLGKYDPNLNGLENNMNSDLQGSKAGVLRKIVYPTGGISEFEYELNSFENYNIPDDNNSVLTTGFLVDKNNFGDYSTQIFSSDKHSLIYGYNGGMSISTNGPLSSNTNALSAYIRLTILKKTTANQQLIASSNFLSMYNNTSLGNADPTKQLGTYVNDIISDSKYLGLDFNTTTQSYNTLNYLNNFYITLDPDKIYILQAYLSPDFGTQSNSTQNASAQVWFKYLKNSRHTLSYGAGLRIKTVKNYETTSPPIYKKYSYEGGKLMSPLLFLKNSSYKFLDLDPIGSAATDIIYSTTVSSSSFLPISSNASGKYVGYSKVEETNLSLDANNNLVPNLNGKKVDYYLNEQDRGSLNSLGNIADPGTIDDGSFFYSNYIDGYDNLNFIAPLRKSNFQNGLIRESHVYDKNGNIIEKTINNWKTLLPSNYFYHRVSSLAYTVSASPLGKISESSYYVGYYTINSIQTVLDSTIKISYSGTDAFQQSQKYFYDSYNQINQIRKVDSKKNIKNVYYTHLYDYPSLYSTLVDQNNLLTPIVETKEELVTSKPEIITTSKNIYSQIGGGSIGPLTYNIVKEQFSLGNKLLEDKIVYDYYSTINRPDKYKLLQYHTRDGITTSVFWGYNGQYPVAKVVGSNYATLSLLIDQSKLDNINNLYNESDIRLELNKLRSLPNTFVTTYTYAPLVGVTSVTDANNRTMYYEYDAVQRLQRIKDQDGNILKQFEYQFQTCAAPFINTERSKIFIKSNCTSGFVGDRLNYTVPAGKYSSCISADIVETFVQNDINTNGQFAIDNNPTLGCKTLNYSLQLEPGWISYYSTPLSPIGNKVNASFVVAATNSNVFTSIRTGVLLGRIILNANSGNCFPTADRQIYYSSNGRSWLITIKTGGEVWLRLVSTTSTPALNEVILLTGGQYTL